MGLHFRAVAYYGLPIQSKALSERKLREWLGASEELDWDALRDAARERGVWIETLGAETLLSVTEPVWIDRDDEQSKRLPFADEAEDFAALQSLCRAIGVEMVVNWWLSPSYC